MREKYLFHGRSSYDLSRAMVAGVGKAVDEIADAQLVTDPVEELVEQVARKMALDVPQIDLAGVTTNQEECEIEVNPHHREFLGGPRTVKGTTFKFFVPFKGDPDLFQFSPSRGQIPPPAAEIEGKELVVSFVAANPDAAKLKKDFEATANQIQNSLDQLRADLQHTPDEIRREAKRIIEQRRDKRIKDGTTLDQIGFPKRRSQ